MASRKSRKPAKSARKPKKLGFKIGVTLPLVGNSRKADIAIVGPKGAAIATHRADLGDDRDRTRLANKLAKQLNKGTPDQWETALQSAHLEALNQHKAAQQAVQSTAQTPCSPCSPGSMYKVEAGHICLTRYTPNGEIDIPLCNFTASITECLRVDDGSGEIEQHFSVTGTLDNGTFLPQATITAAQFMPMNWPVACWGHRAIVTAGQSMRDHLRAAIQWLSQQARERTVFKHVGWRQIDDNWAFLHAKGAITAEGISTDISVDLDGPLARYDLPVPPTGDDLKTAVMASLRLLKLPLRLIVPILGAVFRSVLGTVDWSLHVVGRTGLGKSELIALGQQHFGASMGRLNLPASWQSTGNALEGLAFLAKDAVLAVDDFKPGGSKATIDQIHQLADRVLRAQGNRSGQARCRQDGTVKAPRPPRGLILSSGEDVPRGESLQARLFIVHISKGEIDVRDLTPFQNDAAEGLYAAAMSAYLCWLAPQYRALHNSLDSERAELRSAAMSSIAHTRTPGIVADMVLGWTHFLRFAEESGIITEEDRNRITEDVWKALAKVADEQAMDLAEQDPVLRFLKLLHTTLTSGRAHVTDRDGGEPLNPEMWGWRAEQGGSSDSGPRNKPQGRQVGWIDGDDLFLDPDAAYAEVQRLGDDQGDRLAVSRPQLCRQIKEAAFLRSCETDKTTSRRTLQGRERAVLHLSVGSLLPPKTGGTGGTGSNPEKNGEISPISPPCGPAQIGQQGAPMGGLAAGQYQNRAVPPVPPVPPVFETDEIPP
jgi:hypothetical protein